MLVVGLDMSITSTGLCVMDATTKKTIVTRRFATAAKQGGDFTRVVSIYHSIVSFFRNISENPSLFAMEDYGPINKFAGKVTARAELCGLLKYEILYKMEKPLILVPPTSLKRFATGKGRSTKDDMIMAANKKGQYLETTDEVDAYFAACLASEIQNGGKHGVNYLRINPY